MKAITSFSGDYRFLSNFWPVEVEFEGLVYPSTEAAYQAAKTKDNGERKVFTTLSAKDAKRKGRGLSIRSDWESVKVSVMRDLLYKKFVPGSELAQMLLDTEEAELIESNHWNDVFWGVCRGKGKNYLGRLLMEVRSHLKLVR